MQRWSWRSGFLFALLLVGLGAPPSLWAHRSGCHRWHSCPSDTGSYVCGGLGYCSQCPDNQHCQGGQPRLTGQQTLPSSELSGTQAESLPVKLVSLTSPVRPGGDAALTIQTVPNATCTITVRYKSGPSTAKGLVPKTSDSQGRASWTWVIGSRTTPGTWPISVTCSVGERLGTLRTSFVVH